MIITTISIVRCCCCLELHVVHVNEMHILTMGDEDDDDDDGEDDGDVQQ